MVEVSKRELLQELADTPLGVSPELQQRPLDENGRIEPEVSAVAKRCSKVWLPQGRHPARRGACNEPNAQQIDIEDAVEAAGGKRGKAA